MASIPLEGSYREDHSFHTEAVNTADFMTHHLKNGVEYNLTGPARYACDFVSDIYHGWEITDYHKRKNRGELLPVTPYTKCTQSLKVTGKYNLLSWTNNGQVWSNYREQIAGPAGAPFLPFGSDHTTYPFDFAIGNLAAQYIEEFGINKSYLVQAAASKIYSRGWDAATFLAELGKTIQLLQSTAHSIANFWDEFSIVEQKWLRNGPEQWLIDTTFHKWLEARYGWRLLAYDMQDIAKTLIDWDEEARTRQKDRVGVEFAKTEDFSSVSVQASAIRTYTDTRKVRINVRGAVIADFLPARIQLNPFVTGWEVIPYSFVVDWFLGVGQAIDALSFIVLNDRYTASVSTGFYGHREGLLSVVPRGDAVLDAYQTVDQDYEYFERTPTIVSSLPQYVSQFDVPKGFDLTALLFGLFGGWLKRASFR